MRRRFVATLGYHEDRIVRRLMTSGACPEDEVFILTADPVVPQVKRAFESLKNLMSRAGLGKPTLITVPEDPAEGVIRIAEVLASNDDLVIDLSGGMRYLIIYTLLALAIVKKDATIYVQPEGGEATEIEIPRPLVKLLTEPPTEAEILLLKALDKAPGARDEEIAALMGRKLKTIKNTLTSLKKKGLINKKGRKGGVYLTRWGQAAICVHELMND